MRETLLQSKVNGLLSRRLTIVLLASAKRYSSLQYLESSTASRRELSFDSSSPV